jgi:RimJ/RimL family protein N-acetyltransferase
MTSVALRDGTLVTLRPIRGEDEAELTRLHERLSPETAYQRFFAVVRRLPPDWAHILAHVDCDRRMALLAFGPDGELIGVARYEYDPVAGEAEVAIVVQDRWQGRGLGGRLLEELLAYAGSRGIERFLAYVLPDNYRMLRLLAEKTRVLARRSEPGVTAVRFARRAPTSPDRLEQ